MILNRNGKEWDINSTEEKKNLFENETLKIVCEEWNWKLSE